MYVCILRCLYVCEDCYGAAGGGKETSLPNGVGGAVSHEVSKNKILQVVLVSPQVLLGSNFPSF